MIREKKKDVKKDVVLKVTKERRKCEVREMVMGGEEELEKGREDEK